MGQFNVNPTSTTGVQLMAGATGKKARFINFGFSNNGAATRLLTIYDGTASGGTARITIALAAGAGDYFRANRHGEMVFPKKWFTAGSAVECALDAGGDVRVFGEVVAEA